jgi:hypothetical protein
LKSRKQRSKRRKKRSGGRSASSGDGQQERTPIGFDYGCLPRTMVLSSFDFVQNMSRAGVVGVAYGRRWSNAVGAQLPEITVIAEDPDRLRRAFEEFARWASQSDGDALEVTIIFRDAGGYILALSPNLVRLESRCLGFDRTQEAIPTFAVWCKPVDTTSPVLRDLREYSAHFSAPILFNGAQIAAGAGSLNLTIGTPLHAITGLEPLLKFELTFVDENLVVPGTIAAMALRLQAASDEPGGGTQATPQPDAPLTIAKRRNRALRTHFPVTLERLRRGKSVDLVCAELAPVNAQRWQVEQAVCNLTLAADLPSGVRPRGPRVSVTKLMDLLKTRYEVADGASLAAFSAQQLAPQIMADAKMLTKFLGSKKPINDLSSAQRALALAGLLEAETAAPCDVE